MTRKDYELIARAFRKVEARDFALEIKRRLIDELVDELAAANPNFKADKFRAACGWGG